MKFQLHPRILAIFIAAALAVSASEESTNLTPETEKPVFEPTTIKAPFLEQFTADWSKRWSPSEATKETKEGNEIFSYVGEWSVEEPHVFPGIEGDTGLVVKTAAAHHAISAKFDEPLDNTGKTLVIQYEVKLQNGLECGGAYLKLLTESEKGIQAQEFSDKTPYTIMFGPDRCGSTNKVHFIFRHKNPITGEYEEKHLKSPPSAKIAKTSTLYTLIVRSDNTFDLRINNETEKTGHLLEDFEPAVNPQKEIEDPNDSKPDDWVDNPKIPDPDAKKPDDWDEDAPVEIPDEDAVKPDDWLEDEAETIPDPSVEKPEDWVDDDDGDWTPPLISNPKCEEVSGCGPWKRPNKRNPAYKGKWYPPQIDNPAYKGPWAPRKIPNPDYFEDLTPSNFEKIAGIGFELWTMQSDILFDNIYIGHSEEDAQKFAEETWAVKHKIEKATEDKENEMPASQESAPVFSDDPVAFGQYHINKFLVQFYDDPLDAITSHPQTVGFLVVSFLTFFGLVGVLLNLLTPAKKPVAPHKKTDAVTPDDKDVDDDNDESGNLKDEGNEGDNEEDENTNKTQRRRTPREN